MAELTVEIHLGRGLERFGAGLTAGTMRVPLGTRIKDIICQLGIPPGNVGVISRNGVLADREETLADGDVLSLYPPIGGGS